LIREAERKLADERGAAAVSSSMAHSSNYPSLPIRRSRHHSNVPRDC
jgi:hypothetical protein